MFKLFKEHFTWARKWFLNEKHGFILSENSLILQKPFRQVGQRERSASNPLSLSKAVTIGILVTSCWRQQSGTKYWGKSFFLIFTPKGVRKKCQNVLLGLKFEKLTLFQDLVQLWATIFGFWWQNVNCYGIFISKMLKSVAKIQKLSPTLWCIIVALKMHSMGFVI